MPLFATLRRRIFAILAVAITLFAGGTYGFASWYLRRVFTAAEEEEVRCHLTRYRGAIGERLRDLRRQIEQADARQRCLRLLAMSAEDFGAEQRRLALNDPQQRWLALIAENGEILAGRGYNAENAALLPVPSALGRHFAGASPLRLRLANSEVLEGILLLPEDPPLMVAATLVANEGATAALVAAQALCLREISRLCQSGYLSVSLKRWEAAAPATAHRLLTSAAAGDIFSAAGEDETSALCLLRDIYGKPALLLEMRLPRIVYAQAWLGIEYATLVVLLTGVVLGFLFLLFFDLSVLRRLSRTREAVAAIESGALDPSAFSLSGRDELSRLADTVANMARSLQEYQAGLRQARDLLEQKVKQRRAELVEAHGRLQQEMEERQRLEAAVQRAERLRELAAVAASVGQAVDEPLSNLRAGLTSLENLLRAATEPKREEVLILFQSLTAHRRRLAAVLDQVRCLIRGREMHPQWRTNLAPCLAEAIAIFAVSCPSAPCPLIDCEDRLPVLAVPAVPLQHMLVYLLETLATAADTAAAVCISARREGERVRVRLSHPQARPAVIAQKPWRLVLAQALAFSWNADYQVEEIGDTVAIALGLPVAASPSQPL